MANKRTWPFRSSLPPRIYNRGQAFAEERTAGRGPITLARDVLAVEPESERRGLDDLLLEVFEVAARVDRNAEVTTISSRIGWVSGSVLAAVAESADCASATEATKPVASTTVETAFDRCICAVNISISDPIIRREIQ